MRQTLRQRASKTYQTTKRIFQHPQEHQSAHRRVPVSLANLPPPHLVSSAPPVPLPDHSPSTATIPAFLTWPSHCHVDSGYLPPVIAQSKEESVLRIRQLLLLSCHRRTRGWLYTNGDSPAIVFLGDGGNVILRPQVNVVILERMSDEAALKRTLGSLSNGIASKICSTP